MKLAKIIALAAIMPLAGTAYAGSSAPSNEPAKVDCESAWKTVSSGGDVDMTKAAPYVTDFKQTDKNGDGKLSADEWTNACSQGMIKAGLDSNSSTGSGSSSGEAGSGTNTDGGKTSDRSPGSGTERTPNAGTAGPAGADAGQTPSGTSDRTPDK